MNSVVGVYVIYTSATIMHFSILFYTSEWSVWTSDFSSWSLAKAYLNIGEYSKFASISASHIVAK